VILLHSRIKFRHIYKRKEALLEGGQGPEEAAVPYMDGMNGRIQKNR
jgi:hypothetical protein